MTGAADHDRDDFRVGLAGDLRNRPVEPKTLGARLDLVGEVDGEPAVTLELAHQPARHEHVLALNTMVRARLRNGSSQPALAE